MFCTFGGPHKILHYLSLSWAAVLFCSLRDSLSQKTKHQEVFLVTKLYTGLLGYIIKIAQFFIEIVLIESNPCMKFSFNSFAISFAKQTGSLNFRHFRNVDRKSNNFMRLPEIKKCWWIILRKLSNSRNIKKSVNFSDSLHAPGSVGWPVPSYNQYRIWLRIWFYSKSIHHWQVARLQLCQILINLDQRIFNLIFSNRRCQFAGSAKKTHSDKQKTFCSLKHFYSTKWKIQEKSIENRSRKMGQSPETGTSLELGHVLKWLTVTNRMRAVVEQD